MSHAKVLVIGDDYEALMTPGPAPRAEQRWVALNCHVTAVLGRYDTEEEAVAAATEAGRCSFAYELTIEEAEAMSKGGE